VSTKILWPRKREVGVAYCRILLHDTMLNADAFRTGVAESSICACKTDNEAVEHVLFRCANYDHCRTQLMDVVDNRGLYGFLLPLRTLFTAKHTC